MTRFDLFLADLQALAVLLVARVASITAGAVVALGLAVGLGLAPGGATLAAVGCVLLADQLGLRLAPLLDPANGPAMPEVVFVPLQLVRPVEATSRLGLPAVGSRA